MAAYRSLISNLFDNLRLTWLYVNLWAHDNEIAIKNINGFVIDTHWDIVFVFSNENNACESTEEAEASVIWTRTSIMDYLAYSPS